MWDWLIDLDKQLSLGINDLGGHPLVDSVMVFASHKMTWIPLYIGLIVFLFWRLGWKRALVFLAAVGLTFLACDQLSNVFKHGFERLRPAYDGDMVRSGVRILEGRGGMFGFFSAHAANVFGVACCVIVAFRTDRAHSYGWLTAGMILWALLVSISRVFVGKHFFGDVLVGIVIGTALGLAFGMLGRYLIRRFGWK